MYYRTTFLVSMILVLSCVLAHADFECPDGEASVVCRFLAQQHSGACLRITLVTGETFKARLDCVDNKEIQVERNGRIQVIPYSDIQEVKKASCIWKRVKTIAIRTLSVTYAVGRVPVLAVLGALYGLYFGFLIAIFGV